ncbi:hypothetical protein, partial [Pseudomonas lopnurensis]|uniref:hypothetical protein n=1 Tax=Pseudomonas lopnurensis TaxID=1477517 RepID=UPI00187924DD
TTPYGSACACRRTRRLQRSSASSGNSGNGIGVFHQKREVFFRISLETNPAVWFQLKDFDDPTPSGDGFGELRPDGSVQGGAFLTSVEGRAYAVANEHRIGGASGVKMTGSGLLKHQTDIDYGEWSAGLLITANPKDFKAGAQAVDIRTWVSGSFGDFVRQALSKR